MGKVSLKVEDTSIPQVSVGGRLDKYWNKYGIRDFAKQGKTDLKPKMDPFGLMTKYNLKGVEFGNWVTNEDRLNFIETADRSLLTMAKGLKLDNRAIGLLMQVGIAYGARGSGKALAHYEPGTGMINLTRYHADETTERTKPVMFFKSGGMQSFAHEWGHAVDYFLGTYFDQSTESRAITYGRMVILNKKNWSIYDRINLEKGSYRWLAREILAVIMWSKRGSTYSSYYARLLKRMKDDESFGEYWIRTNELFARVFEQYVHLKLQGIGIRKGFLVKNKYSLPGGFNVYVSPEQLKKIVPFLDKIMAKMKADIKKIKQ